MERISEEHFGRASLREEHFHRYRIASLVSSGRVVDCACGVGYGAELLRGNPAVTSYLGIDPSEESVAFANTTYARAGTAFETGTIENNRCGPGTVDTFVMLETLEHTQDPAECLRNIRLRLAENGLLIGSVPSAHYEGVCERVYGPNPFHLQRFTQEELSRHLGVHFESMRFFAAEFVLGTLLRPLDGSAGVGAEMEHPVSPQDEVMGSIMFLAGAAKRVQQAMKVLKKPFRFYPGLAKAKLDEEEVEAVRRVLRQTETLATARWEIMQDMDAMIRDRDKALTSLNAMVGDRDTAITSLKAMVGDRDTAITSLNAMVGDRDTAITSLNAVVADLRAVAASQENKVQHLEGMLSDREDLLDFKRSLIRQQLDMTGSIIRRMGHRAALKALRTVEQDHVPFRDLAFSLYLFCARLMDRVRDGKIGDLFFFSREGYFLKQMFDTLRTLTPDCPAVRTHYLQVSRRSTFLISLGPLESESFEVLFRQYRRISLHDFLSSLALDDHSAVIAADIGIAQDEVHKVRDDLPTDAVFASLMASEVFRTLYRDEKEKRSAAFKSYIEGLVGGQLPQALHV
ncbi:MAG: methyltransferase domain-containing protein, partial [Rhizobiales bacterium]|nr:methyltransferase domain-containing protein [Hyphomicrobiales bacterium]